MSDLREIISREMLLPSNQIKLPNIDLQRIIGESLIQRKYIAHKLDISDATFSRWLRYELPPEKKERIKNVVKQLIAERGW